MCDDLSVVIFFLLLINIKLVNGYVPCSSLNAQVHDISVVRLSTSG